jgi:hypothetical protein
MNNEPELILIGDSLLERAIIKLQHELHRVAQVSIKGIKYSNGGVQSIELKVKYLKDEEIEPMKPLDFLALKELWGR